MKFNVTCTMIYNGNITVDAKSEEEALELVSDQLCHEYGDDFPDDGKFGIVNFTFGEATADYAEEVED